jgi:flagellar motility protein MotE (MotC chaperone)
LKPKQAAKILGQVEPELAARLTGKMASVKKKKKKRKR